MNKINKANKDSRSQGFEGSSEMIAEIHRFALPYFILT